MHILIDLSFFIMNKTSAPYGDALGWMKPMSSNSYSWTFNSLNFACAIVIPWPLIQIKYVLIGMHVLGLFKVLEGRILDLFEFSTWANDRSWIPNVQG